MKNYPTACDLQQLLEARPDILDRILSDVLTVDLDEAGDRMEVEQLERWDGCE